jgi:hypothetical protein
MHFEQDKADTGHYHKHLEIRNDAGALAAELQATRAGITITPSPGFHIRITTTDGCETEAHIGIEANS